MKNKNIFIVFILIFTLVFFGGCGTKADPAEVSEHAMENFVEKINSGNYVVNAEGYLKATAYSEDLVYFDYEDNSAYTDFAVMSVDNEVFQGPLEEGGIGEVQYLKEGTALEASSGRLPSGWIDLADGNIFNLFYNDQENPLKFVSYDDAIKDQARSMVGYGQVAMNYMEEVYLTFDKEDPKVAHITAVVNDDEVARYYFDDIDVTITFGDAATDERAEAWMNDPVYPEARTEWSEGDIFVFNSVFLPEYGEEAVPFIQSASYALSVDDERFLSDDAVYIRDPHAEEADVEAYIETLKQNGFEEATEEDGTYYRKMLRENTKCYSSIAVEYDNGMNLTAKKYYDFPKYEGLDEINAQITANGYPALTETDVMTGLTATDTRFEQTESWLYFYDYNTNLYVYGKYEDQDKVTEYLDAYASGLVNDGYSHVYVDNDEEGEIDHYRSEDESMSFRYHFEDDGETVILLFKAEKCLTADETKTILSQAGFPDIDLSAYVTGRDHTRFQKVMYGKTYDSAVSLSMKFAASEEAEGYLDKLAADLEDNGFYRVPASELGSNKSNGYTNEDKGLGVAFDLYPGEDGGESYIYFEFKSGIDFETEGGDEGEGNHPILGSKHMDEFEEAH